ncbi:heterokaryon incompatibility protein-domain-containing protein [Stachybotrys elegans]|uniref:Heterokaryon incompatibility protein-domain-containing protein n=1 Tax=Stachybotrys elegans TaxID=80388 RepID=A0A8K0SMJ3_9HYPO|nr:heterokaryon incompatibility protein-domain-containing protein [Stachybotrys elegans]
MEADQPCRYCANLSVEKLVRLAKEEYQGYTCPDKAYYQHHLSIADLEASAHGGCHLCMLILDSSKRVHAYEDVVMDKDGYQFYSPLDLSTYRPSTKTSVYTEACGREKSDVKIFLDTTQLSIRQHLAEVSIMDLVRIQIGLAFSDDPDELWALSFITLTLTVPRGAKQLEKIGDLEIGRFELPSSLASPDFFRLANTWLQECRQKHTTCAHFNRPSQLPSRVVDVGAPGDAPRIFCSRGIDADYAALSHCWGGAVFNKLTTKNLAQYEKTLPESLPQNFLDAITITREMGLRYIWIDSLCILQDSEDDWRTESANMGKIYINASLMISASVSKDCATGILGEHFKPKSTLPSVHLPLRDAPESGTVLRLDLFDVREESLNLIDLYAPLGTRGWTLQESFLAPRQLIYGSEQIYWDCLDTVRSARGPCAPYIDPYNNLKRQVLLPVPESSPQQVKTMLYEYYRMVDAFSRRKLTYSSDRLMAISGVVNRLHGIFGGVYLAGIWSQHLSFGLCWERDSMTYERAVPYRGPTWSWAGLESPVLYYLERILEPYHSTVKMVDHSVTLRDEQNPFGQVTSASLTIEASVMPVLNSYQVVNLDSNHDPGTINGKASFDDPRTGSRWSEAVTSTRIADGGQNERLLVTWPGEISRTIMRLNLVDAMELATEYKAAVLNTRHTHDQSIGVEAEGIILRRVSPTKGLYERIGYFFFDGFDMEGLGRETLKVV